MRFLVEAVNDVSQRIGDRVFENKKGETLELSSQGFEVAMSQMMDGAYKLVREIAETDFEKEDAARAEKVEKTREKLFHTPKETLVKKAAKLNIETRGLPKTDLVDVILETTNEGGQVVGTTTDAAGSNKGA